MIDLISIGDSALDIFLHIHEASVSCQLNKSQCVLCLEYANKIPVESVTKVPGAGNASNVAVGARRLGLTSSLVSHVGMDDVGQEMLRYWKKEKVGTRLVHVDRMHETNYSTVLVFQGERTILMHSQPRTYQLPPLEPSHWVYYTAIGTRHERLEKDLLRYLKRSSPTRLAFNPGGTQLKRGLKALQPVIARSELFIVNKEEAERLLEDGVRPVPNLLMSFVHLGAKIVVITDGPNGSFATDGKTMWHCPIFPGKIVERTGAGDSFGTTFVYALNRNWPLPEAMRAGTANAWSVVQKIGPQAGLLTTDELTRAMKKFAKIQPTIIS
jgi:ribokinase